MTDDAIPHRGFFFIPETHVVERTQRAFVWKAALAVAMECWEPHLDSLIVRVEACLDFRLSCPLHLVVYESNEQTQSCLGRQVPPNMLLAPLVGSPASVIAVQPATAHPANGDPARMKRHLCHELAHVLVALRTQSTKRLGDEGANMRVPSWVNEGIAEYVAATVCEEPHRLLQAHSRAASVSDRTDLDTALHDLCSVRRADAFSVATARVWDAIRTRGTRYVFRNLTEPSLWFSQVTQPTRPRRGEPDAQSFATSELTETPD